MREWLGKILRCLFCYIVQRAPCSGTILTFSREYVAYCALTGDLPLTRVKFNARQEYEYLANFKILQNHFKAKKVDKVRRCLPAWTLDPHLLVDPH